MNHQQTIQAFTQTRAAQAIKDQLFSRMPLLRAITGKSPITDLRVAMILRMQGLQTGMSLMEIWRRIKIKHSLTYGLGRPLPRLSNGL